MKIKIIRCNQCNTYFSDMRTLNRHRARCRPDQHPSIPIAENQYVRRFEVNSAINNSVRITRFQPTSNSMLPREFLIHSRPLIEDTRDLLLSECTECKINVILCINISKTDEKNEVVYDTYYVSIEAKPLDIFFIDAINDLLESKIAYFMNRGSNWQIDGVSYMDYHITRYCSIRQIAGRGIRTLLKLPDKLQRKKAVINVTNPGDNCFQYALLSILHYHDFKGTEVKNRTRHTKYTKWLQEHKWKGTFKFIFFN